MKRDDYTSWVNSTDCQLCGATMIIDYRGEDAKGNPISLRAKFVMKKAEE